MIAAVPRLRWQDVPLGTLDLAGQPLDLARTFQSGQVFRWQMVDGWWVGAIGRHAVRLRHDGPRAIAYQIVPAPVDPVRLLARFFRLDVDLTALAAAWSTDPTLALAIERHRGLRVLGQEPVETLCTFLCTAANHVPRITASLVALAAHYGEVIAEVDGQPIHAFPTLARLARASGAELWQRADLGYRGALLQRAAAWLTARGAGWLDSLRALPYPAARRALLAIPGVGLKVADCVCLFGLGFDQAVPIDTHIWAVARDLFGDQIPTRSLTPATYQRVVDLFGERFGRYAGWVQQYLFHDRRLARQHRGEPAA